MKYGKSQIGIIGVSAYGAGNLSVKFLKKGANDFIMKPFLDEEFYCRVNQNIEMLEHIDAVQEASNKDFLVQLHNRRYFFEAGQHLFENAKRGYFAIAIAMIDIDYFKSINDNFGHETGDIAIKHIASLISENLRGMDIIARFGGDEFCILATKMNIENTKKLFDRLCQKVEDSYIMVDKIKISMTISIGITTKLGKDLNATVNQADKMLYKAKKAGRNTIIIQ